MWQAQSGWAGGTGREDGTGLPSAVTGWWPLGKVRGGGRGPPRRSGPSLFSGRTVTAPVPFPGQPALHRVQEGLPVAVKCSFGGTEKLSQWIKSSVGTGAVGAGRLRPERASVLSGNRPHWP